MSKEFRLLLVMGVLILISGSVFGQSSLLSEGRPAFSSSDENADNTAGNAVDGDASTRWSSGFSDPQWIYVDLGITSMISQVILRWEAAFGSVYDIQVSYDASNWTTIYSQDNGKGGQEDLSVSGVGRYVRIYGTARGTEWGYSLWDLEIYGEFGTRTMSIMPVPEDNATDIPFETILSWEPGESAVTHTIYLGTTFEDVNNATPGNPLDVRLCEGLDANSFDPGRLAFDTTYYWRVDEVNGAPDYSVFKGSVWSFTVEPYLIQVPGSAISVTASSISSDVSKPDKTIDGSGLGADGTVAITGETMWFSKSPDLDPWIQYEFDEAKKLEVMKVWNSNTALESGLGWGVKDVRIEYSVDGIHWDVLADANQFSRATGEPTYDQFDEIAFGGVAVKYVRLNILSNWGGILKSCSLSEVQFIVVPTVAKIPMPASASVDIQPDSVIKWRSGHQVDHHVIYMSTDEHAVTDGLADSVTSQTNSLDLSVLDLELGETYYWRVDEVNEAEAVAAWAGPVWSLRVSEALTVEDFESYANFSPDRPFQTWIDGYGYSADKFFPVTNPGNGSGAGVGHDIWSIGSPYYNGTIMEQASAKRGQSMPVYYNNASQVDRVFGTPQDWDTHGVQTLVGNFRGSPGNTGGPLYVKINGKRVTYPDTTHLGLPIWQQWNIDLASLGIDLKAVTSLTLGLDGSGSGVIYVDDILLYKDAPAPIVSVAPSLEGVIATYSMENNVLDGSGQGNHGFVVGAPTYVPGMSGMAIQFNGAGDCIDLGNKAAFNPAGSFSVGVWANITAWTAGWGHVMVGNRGESSVGWQLRRRDNNKVSWTTRGVGQDDDPSSSMDAPLNEWVHIVGVYDKDKGVKQLYINGSLDQELVTTPGAVITPTTYNTYIGARVSANNTPEAFFKGLLDDVVLYDRVLSEAEIRYLAGGR